MVVRYDVQFTMAVYSPPRDARTEVEESGSRLTQADLHLVLKAIMTKELFVVSDKLLNRALAHIFASVHEASIPKEDWVEWLSFVINKIPLGQPVPINSRNRPKKLQRGPAGVAYQNCQNTIAV